MSNDPIVLKMAQAMSDADPVWGREAADPWDARSKYQRARYIRMAIAAAEAMREPSETMLKNVPPRPIWQEEAHAWYRYMIEAELAEGRKLLPHANMAN